MRRLLAAAFVAVLLLAIVPQGQAAINKPRGFHAAFPYMAGLSDDGQMTVISGEAEVTVSGAAGSYGFFDSDGITVTGLEQVCYTNTCTQPQASRPYSLVVAAATVDTDGTREGGSVALCFPSPSAGTLEAKHVLGMFVDLALDDDLNTFPVDKALVAPAVGGNFHFDSVNPIASPGLEPCVNRGGLSALDELTTVHVRNGANLVTSLVGKNARFAFSGQPVVSDVAAGFYILPFNGGCEATFDPASGKSARAGLDLTRVKDLVRKLDNAHESTAVDREDTSSGGDNTEEFLAGLLNGALLRLPEAPAEDGGLNLDGSHFVRFSRLTVVGEGSGVLDWDGKAYLEVEDGKVVGAKNLVGFWLFQLPWWSYLLWVAAITLAIVRFVLKPDKNHPRWDALRWIGWIATPVAWVIVFFLWDFEMHAVMGASLLRGSSGQFKLIIAVLQLGLLGLIAFAAAAPLRMIGRNSFLLAHQGTFMGISGGAAAIVGFLFGAPYLRAYLGLILSKVMERLA